MGGVSNHPKQGKRNHRSALGLFFHCPFLTKKNQRLSQDISFHLPISQMSKLRSGEVQGPIQCLLSFLHVSVFSVYMYFPTLKITAVEEDFLSFLS